MLETAAKGLCDISFQNQGLYIMSYTVNGLKKEGNANAHTAGFIHSKQLVGDCCPISYLAEFA